MEVACATHFNRQLSVSLDFDESNEFIASRQLLLSRTKGLNSVVLIGDSILVCLIVVLFLLKFAREAFRE